MGDNSINFNVDLSLSARQAVRLEFNPAGDDRIARIKMLTAALITECEVIRSEGAAAREASIAITGYEEAAMWAVKAATKEQ